MSCCSRRGSLWRAVPGRRHPARAPFAVSPPFPHLSRREVDAVGLPWRVMGRSTELCRGAAVGSARRLEGRFPPSPRRFPTSPAGRGRRGGPAVQGPPWRVRGRSTELCRGAAVGSARRLEGRFPPSPRRFPTSPAGRGRRGGPVVQGPPSEGSHGRPAVAGDHPARPSSPPHQRCRTPVSTHALRLGVCRRLARWPAARLTYRKGGEPIASAARTSMSSFSGGVSSVAGLP